MPKIAYRDIDFKAGSLALIQRSNQIIAEYEAQGFTLTLRQLYYQLVSRDVIPNKQTEYKRLGSIVNDARLAGLIDWDAIEDRTRWLRSVSHWDEPNDIIASAAYSFRQDKWQRQDYRPEVWIEKDALVGVIEGVCNRLDVPYFACRGYASQSEMWGAAQRMLRHKRNGQTPMVIHLGDHDPSGIDMSRDIQDRLELFLGGYPNGPSFERIALNMTQVEEYDPPPNPAKVTDSRFDGYAREYGDESWELDALEPSVIVRLIEDAVLSVRDEAAWDDAVRQEAIGRAQLKEVSERWEDVEGLIGDVDPLASDDDSEED